VSADDLDAVAEEHKIKELTANTTLAPLGHPAHPETVAFPFACVSCGTTVLRTASHQGGKQWEQNTAPEAEAYKEHVCDPAVAAAYVESLKPKAAPVVELSPSERLAAGENLAPPAAEPDVAAQLDAAGAPAVEEQAKPEAEEA
jgi:hypothetical protein